MNSIDFSDPAVVCLRRELQIERFLSPTRHLVPLTDVKPVNPVPAWNIAAPTRKGELGMLAVSPLQDTKAAPTHVPSLLNLEYELSSSCPHFRPGRSWSAASPPSLL